jgi:hypothetical protein
MRKLRAIKPPRSRGRAGLVPHQLQPPNVVQFAKKLDGLLNLLDATADALAAMEDRVSSEKDFGQADNIKPTMQ